jgi:uncharacterized protein (DUF924 family)
VKPTLGTGRYLPSAAEDRDAEEVLRFWFGEPHQYGRRRKCWFEKSAPFDAEVRDKFFTLFIEMEAGGRPNWLERPAECLARILVLDQFPRHLFRASARAFRADPLALQAARHALASGHDAGMLPVERLFMYLPFEHSETREDQLRGCELMESLRGFAETADAPRYAALHRAIIERFGRFPHRNNALGRPSTDGEREFLRQPGSSF